MFENVNSWINSKISYLTGGGEEDNDTPSRNPLVPMFGGRGNSGATSRSPSMGAIPPVLPMKFRSPSMSAFGILKKEAPSISPSYATFTGHDPSQPKTSGVNDNKSLGRMPSSAFPSSATATSPSVGARDMIGTSVNPKPLPAYARPRGSVGETKGAKDGKGAENGDSKSLKSPESSIASSAGKQAAKSAAQSSFDQGPSKSPRPPESGIQPTGSVSSRGSDGSTKRKKYPSYIAYGPNPPEDCDHDIGPSMMGMSPFPSHKDDMKADKDSPPFQRSMRGPASRGYQPVRRQSSGASSQMTNVDSPDSVRDPLLTKQPETRNSRQSLRSEGSGSMRRQQGDFNRRSSRQSLNEIYQDDPSRSPRVRKGPGERYSSAQDLDRHGGPKSRYGGGQVNHTFRQSSEEDSSLPMGRPRAPSHGNGSRYGSQEFTRRGYRTPRNEADKNKPLSRQGSKETGPETKFQRVRKTPVTQRPPDLTGLPGGPPAPQRKESDKSSGEESKISQRSNRSIVRPRPEVRSAGPNPQERMPLISRGEFKAAMARQSSEDSRPRSSSPDATRSGTSSQATDRGQGNRSASAGRQKVVYYQNRFIAIPTESETGQDGEAQSSGAVQADQTRATGDNVDAGTGYRRGVNMSQIEMDQTSISMQNLGGESPAPSAENTYVVRTSGLYKKNSLFKKMARFLQDNRVKSGSREMQQKLKSMNKNQAAAHQCLKKILNATFVTIGVVLLLSVIVVIIYTTVPKGRLNFNINNIKII